MRQASNQQTIAQFKLKFYIYVKTVRTQSQAQAQAPICDESVLDPLKFSTSHYTVFFNAHFIFPDRI